VEFGKRTRMATQIELFGDIQYAMINPFLDFFAQRINEGETEFLIGVSSPGGNVFCGVSAYNVLKGSGVQITTHNFGHVDSIATLIFCAGSVRRAVPSSRLLIHDVHWGFQSGSYNETSIRESLDGLRADRTLIATILAETMQSEVEEIEEVMRQSLTIQSQDALDRGLVTEITREVYDPHVPIQRFRLS
jgi:ATP-dependent Clp protease, protease subunit